MYIYYIYICIETYHNIYIYIYTLHRLRECISISIYSIRLLYSICISSYDIYKGADKKKIECDWLIDRIVRALRKCHLFSYSI